MPRSGLDYYGARQAVRRLERRDLVTPVATRRRGRQAVPNWSGNVRPKAPISTPSGST